MTVAKEPDYEAMSVDELDAEIVALKRQQNELREKKRLIAEIRKGQVREERVRDRIKAAGLEGVVAMPGTAHMEAEGR